MEKKEYNWGVGIFLMTYQVLLLIGLPIYLWFHVPTWGLVLCSIALFFLSGISITGGYHRYFSHKSFKAHPAVETVLLFFGSMAGQGSALRWANDHRIHHAYVDTDRDPYSIKKGFWYAHFGWLLYKQDPIDPKVVPDLMKNPRVMFQDRYGVLSMVITNALAVVVIGWLLQDYLGAFVIALWVRLFFLHHCTWFINSLAHTWGDKPFCQEQTAVNNLILSFLTFGEGYHNYHHVFANDYRNGVRWYHFDPTKWIIWTLHKLGLATNLRVMDEMTIRKRMVLERKSLLLECLKKHWYIKKEELEGKIQEIASSLEQKIAHYKQLREDLRKLKKEGTPGQAVVATMREELFQLQKSLREDWKKWQQLSRTILRLKPLPVL